MFINVDLNPCRYSTFLILYPTGISSEVGLIYIALPYIKVIWHDAIFSVMNTILHEHDAFTADIAKTLQSFV